MVVQLFQVIHVDSVEVVHLYVIHDAVDLTSELDHLFVVKQLLSLDVLLNHLFLHFEAMKNLVKSVADAEFSQLCLLFEFPVVDEGSVVLFF